MAGAARDMAVVQLHSDQDVVRVRIMVRESLVALGFGLIDQTKLITAASELARNTLTYGGGGEAHVTTIADGARNGIRLAFIDQGPGIVDVALALTDGYSTGNGLGLGLSGAKRLSDEFELTTELGKGTTVVIIRWKVF